MKRLLSLLLVCSLVLSSAAATGGDPNIEGGGGGVGEGGVVGDSAWNPGDDGVRVSVMRGNTAVATFDISNILRTRTQWCYVKKNKLTYKNNGGTLDPMPGANYRNYVPPADIPLPTIIPDSARNNIEAIRNYFTDERVVHFVADKAGMAYDELINGDYKLLLEPIAYFKYNGVQYAMTATEAALFDMKVSGDLRYQMGRMTHQNLPFSMFLERADLTIQPWTGATSGRQANIDILNQLGVGIVSFQPEILIPDPPQAEYVYRCDTDVITAALVVNRGGNLTPYTHSEAGGQVGYATFHINGGNYRKQMVCPAGGTQLVWVRWHTPSTPQEMTITVTPPNGGRDIQILASIVELPEKTPPNPEYDGPGEGPGITHTQYRPNFRLADPPSWGSQVRTEWDQWIATLESEYIEDEDWVADDSEDGGHWEDSSYWVYWWEFALATYTAGLDTTFKLTPNERVPTAELRRGKYTIKSGYGVDAECEVRVATRGNVSDYDVTPVQHVLAVFPEFDYQEYYRLLEPDNAWWYSTTWRFKKNPYSYYDERVHFTPLWYPDIKFPVQAAIFDAWTPGGMLYTTVSDYVDISGSMYDDWYIRLT